MADSSKLVTQSRKNADSCLVKSLFQLGSLINTEVTGQFGHTVIINAGSVTIKNSELDCFFDIPFDDNTEANEAEIGVYNLTDSTIANLKTDTKITVQAGYGNDIGVIFSGYISKRKTVWEECDKVTTLTAIDSEKLSEREIDSITYAANTKASYILKSLCGKIGLPIAEFKVARDHTYTDEETVSGGLMDNIERYAKICGVSAYILKSKIYVRKLSDGDNTSFVLNSDTGLISCEEFEETEKNENYKDTIKGYRLKMLLQHRLQTASIISLDSKNAKGRFRVRSGVHRYDGTEFITEAEVV